MASNADLVACAIDETVACGRLTAEDWSARSQSAYGPLGPFLKAPGGQGQVPTTDRAMTALARLASRLLGADATLARAVSGTTCRKEMALAFGEVLARIQQDQTPRGQWRILRARVLERLDSVRFDILHYLPVWLFIGQQHGLIEVGPIRIVQRSDWPQQIAARKGAPADWLNDVRKLWSVTIDAPAEPLHHVAPELVARTTRFARAVHPDQWVACTLVTGCEKEESRRRAILATRVALDTFRLLLPAPQRRKIRTVEDLAAPIGTDQLMQLSGRDPISGLTINLPGVSGEPGLAKAIVGNGIDVLAAAGACIAHACNAEPATADQLPNLSERWFNAVHWFGRACSADEDYVAVIMLAISLDILSGGGEAPGIAKWLSVLAGHPLKAPVLREGNTSLETLVHKAYRLRSEIAHGSILALHGDWEEPRVQMEELASVALRAYVLALRPFAADAGEDTRDAFASWLHRRQLRAATS